MFTDRILTGLKVAQMQLHARQWPVVFHSLCNFCVLCTRGETGITRGKSRQHRLGPLQQGPEISGDDFRAPVIRQMESPHCTILSWLFRCALRKYTGIGCLCRVLLPWPYELKGRWIAPSWFCLCALFIAKRTVSVISYYSWFLSQGKGWKMEVDRKTPTWRASGTNTMACSHLDFAAETFTPTIYLKWKMIFAWLHLLSIWYVSLCFTTQLFPEHFPITCSGPLSCTIITFQPLSLLGYSTQAKVSARFGPHICK